MNRVTKLTAEALAAVATQYALGRLLSAATSRATEIETTELVDVPAQRHADHERAHPVDR